MYTVEQLEEFLKREGADFELIRQDVPILSAQDAEPYYDAARAAPSFCKATGGWWPVSIRQTGEGSASRR